MNAPDVTMFVGGNQAVKKQRESNYTLYNSTLSYFLWAVLGVGVAIIVLAIPVREEVKHLVVLKYKPDTSSEQINAATSAFKALSYKIPGIVSFEHGNNISSENKDLGFNHVYMITFANAAARDAFIPHPDRTKFDELLNQLDVVEDILVVDFSVK